MTSIARRIAVGSAFALFASTALAGVASAQASADNIKFSATDNKNCTATFEVVNTTNSDWAEINYWTGVLPTEAPAFGKNEGSEQALKANPAFEDADGNTVTPYSERRNKTTPVYVRGLKAVTSTKVVDFSEKAHTEGAVEVRYRMTSPDNKDYDTSLKDLTVTGCGEPEADGSLDDIFGSVTGIFQS